MVDQTDVAKTSYLGRVSAVSAVRDVTLVVNTSQYASGDLLSDVVEIPNAFRGKGLTAILQSVSLTDADGQDAAIDLVFTPLSTSWGTINATAAPSATVIEAKQAVVSLAAADYVDLGTNGSTVEDGNVGKLLKAADDSRSLYVAAISRGTPTYTGASKVKLKVGLLLD